MLKYIFMGTPALAATILEKLVNDLYPPVAIVTQTAKATGRGQKIISSAVESCAKSYDLNVLTSLDVNAAATLDVLKTFEPDLILVAAFGQILKTEILTMPKLACLNVHASLLPKYRGASPVQEAIWNGDSVTGITIQKMAKKLDTGDILLQKTLAIGPDETSGELMDRLAELGGVCLVEAVHLMESGKFRFTPQIEKEASYAGKIDKKDAIVAWTDTASEILNQIRALQPWPVAETVLGKDRLKIFKAVVTSGLENASPATVSTDHKTWITVQCGDGNALSLTEIQLENRKRLNVKDFLLAYRGQFPFTKVGVQG